MGKWIVAFVGFAAAVGVVAFAMQLAERKSSLETLHISAEMFGQAYAVPVTAPFEEFPTRFVQSAYSEDWESCGPEQVDWLAKHGQRFPDVAILTMRNTAETGALLTVKDLATAGTLRSSSAHVRVVCIEPIGGLVDMQTAELTTDATSSAHFVGGELNGPVTYTLAPGETAQTHVWLLSDQDNVFDGSLTAAVISGEESRTVTVDLVPGEPERSAPEGNSITIPPWAPTQELVVAVGRYRTETKLFDCKNMGPSYASTGSQACDPHELRQKLNSLVRR